MKKSMLCPESMYNAWVMQNEVLSTRIDQVRPIHLTSGPLTTWLSSDKKDFLQKQVGFHSNFLLE